MCHTYTYNEQTDSKAKETKSIVKSNKQIQMTLLKEKKGCKIPKFCLFHEINSANAKLIAMVVCLLVSFSLHGFDNTLSGRNARLFPSTC